MASLYVYIVLLLSHEESVTHHEDNISFPPTCTYGLLQREIIQKRNNKFSNKARRHETEKISVWHHAKEKNGEDCQQKRNCDLSRQICEDQPTKPKSKTYENAHRETFEAEKQGKRTLQCHGYQFKTFVSQNKLEYMIIPVLLRIYTKTFIAHTKHCLCVASNTSGGYEHRQNTQAKLLYKHLCK